MRYCFNSGSWLKSRCTSKKQHFYLRQVPVSNFLVCLSFVRGFSQQILRYQSNWNCFNVQDLRISVWSMSPLCLCSVLLVNRYVYIFTVMKYILYVLEKLKFVLLLQKTKPTQHSIRDLRGLGLSPDIIACRSTKVYLLILVSSPLVLLYIIKTLIILFFFSPVGTWRECKRKAISILLCSGMMGSLLLSSLLEISGLLVFLISFQCLLFSGAEYLISPWCSQHLAHSLVAQGIIIQRPGYLVSY